MCIISDKNFGKMNLLYIPMSTMFICSTIRINYIACQKMPNNKSCQFSHLRIKTIVLPTTPIKLKSQFVKLPQTLGDQHTLTGVRQSPLDRGGHSIRRTQIGCVHPTTSRVRKNFHKSTNEKRLASSKHIQHNIIKLYPVGFRCNFESMLF